MRFVPFQAAESCAAAARDLIAALRFYTRLPIPALAFEGRDPGRANFGRALRMAPLAGAILGCFGAATLGLAEALGLPALLVALLALTVTIWLGGALHEDGLADVADGFGGGRTRIRKLEIMRDSSIGSYGALAIGASLALRGAALAGLMERFGTGQAAAALVAAAALSRGFGLMPLAWLPPARRDGLGAAAAAGPGDGRQKPCEIGIGLAGLCGMAILLATGFDGMHALTACALAFAASFGVTRLSARQIGGQTGDVAGAAQQGAEIAFLSGLLIGPHLG